MTHPSWLVVGFGRWNAKGAVFEAIAVSRSCDDFGVVDETVDYGCGYDVVTEDFTAAAEGFIGGDDQAGAFVARGHQLQDA